MSDEKRCEDCGSTERLWFHDGRTLCQSCLNEVLTSEDDDLALQWEDDDDYF